VRHCLAAYLRRRDTSRGSIREGLLRFRLRRSVQARFRDDGVAVIVTTPGSAIQVGNNSVVKINKLAFAKSGGSVTQRTASLQLQNGVVSALIDPSTPKITDFQVQTPEGAAAARGTFYAVLVYHGKTYVGVKEGHVAVKANGQ
jgi:hypothetical protein